MKKMKKNTIVVLLVAILTVTISFCGGAYAASNLEAISAYLNYGIKIEYNSSEQTLKDEKGNQVYPISYNGTTYIPIRAASNMFGIPVDWDSKTNTILLGKTDGKATSSKVNLIDDIGLYYQSLVTEKKSTSGTPTKIGTETVSSYIDILDIGSCYCNYNLEGKYSTLTFKAYSPSERTFTIYGDNDTVLKTGAIKAGDLPVEFTVNVSGVKKLTIDSSDNGCFATHLYMFNMYVD